MVGSGPDRRGRRLALPGAVLFGARRVSTVDVTLAVVVLGQGSVELWFAGALPPGGTAVQAVYLAGIAVAVLLRSVLPEWSAGVYLLSTVFVCSISQPYEMLAVGLAFTVLPFLFAASQDGRRAWLLLGLLHVAVAIRSLDDPQQDWFARALDQAWVLQSEVAGVVVRRWRRRADHLARAAAERARDAVELERARIARELHDIVGHQVTAVIVTADAARGALDDALARTDTAGTERGLEALESARAALEAIETTGRQCLTEMRHLLGLLRQDIPDPPDTPGPTPDRGGPTAHGRAPGAPPAGLDQLEELLDNVRAAGLPARLHRSGTPAPLSAGVSLAAYRVVQESLTNTLRHAGAARTDVHLDWTTEHLTVRVQDDGAGTTLGRVPGAEATRSHQDLTETTARTEESGGRGLIGLRERVRIFGGTLTAGPTRPASAARGWTVTAVLPLDGAAASAFPTPQGLT